MRLIWVMLLALMAVTPAWASVQVVADGGGTRRTEPKSWEMKVQIAGGFAQTTAHWTFSNTQPQPFEAEFIAEAPKDAVVSSFAYWFKGKKVRAYIVEKARAAQIYHQIVTRRRDPALVEMLARNYFRARISPVEAGKNLRVEVTWVQPLYWKNNALVYDCPIWREGETLNVETWRVSGSIQAAPGIFKVENNFGAAVESQNVAGGSLAFSLNANGQKTPPQTLQIRMPIAGAALPVLATASASGGKPYFAILSSKVPGKSWRAGANEVFTARLKGGGGFLMVGRGALPKNVRRLDVPGGGEKLWAARKLDDLARDDRNYSTGLKLSVRYGLPSKWTNWLAIPDEERARLKDIIENSKREQAQDNIALLGKQMALEVAAGREKTRGYASMKQQFIENCLYLKLQPTPGEVLQGYFDTVHYDLSYQLYNLGKVDSTGDSEKDIAVARALYAQIKRLEGRFPSKHSPDEPLGRGWAATNLANVIAAAQVRRLEKTILQGRTDSRLRAAVEAGAPVSLGREARWAGLQVAFERLVQTWAEQKVKPGSNPRVLKELRTQVERVLAKQRALIPPDKSIPAQTIQFHDVSSSALRYAEDSRYTGRIYELKNAIDKEIVARRENGERARRLQSELRAIKARLSTPLSALKEETGIINQHVLKTVDKLRTEQVQLQPDTDKIAALQAELNRVKPFLTPKSFQESVDKSESEWRGKAPEQLAKQWSKVYYGASRDAKATELYTAQIQKILDEDREAYKKGKTPAFHSSTLPSADKKDGAVYFLQSAEISWLYDQCNTLLEQVLDEHRALVPNEARIAALQAQLDVVQKKALYNKTYFDGWIAARLIDPYFRSQIFQKALTDLREQNKRLAPDSALVARLENRVIAYQNADSYYEVARYYGGSRQPEDPQEYGKLRVERIAVRAQREKATTQLKQMPKVAALRTQVAELTRRENELTVRMGDPLIAVTAPADCRQVTAILPTGEIKPLRFNVQAKQWEARFDVPSYLSEGDYAVTIIVVAKNGARKHLTMRFRVDITAPQGAGSVAADGGAWLLSLQTGKETDRVKALLPWGDRVDLRRENGVFQARVAFPKNWQEPAKVIYLLTDLAHNQTRLEVDMAP